MLRIALVAVALSSFAACNRDPAPTVRTAPETPRDPPSSAPPTSGAPVVEIAPPPSASAIDDAAVPPASGGCTVAITGVLEAAIYRGPGVDSPSRRAYIDNLPEETKRRWAGRDHGVKHLACTYSVRVNRDRYRYRHNAGQDFTNQDDLDPKTCSKDETKREVEKEIRDFTKQCTDLTAGEYWGYRLEPMPTP